MSATSRIPGKLVDGVFRKALAADLTPTLLEQLAAVGLDVSLPQQQPCERDVWYRAVGVMAAALYPQQLPPAQLRGLGRHLIQALKTRNIIKGGWLSMAKLLGPRRALLKAADFAKGSPITLTLVERGKHEVEVSVDEAEQLEFLAGLLEGAVELLGGRTASAEILRREPGGATFVARWS